MMLQIQTKCLFSQTCGFFITFIVFLSLVKIVWCLFVIWNKEKEQRRLLPIRKHREERENGIASAVPFSHFSIDAVTFDISKAPMPL